MGKSVLNGLMLVADGTVSYWVQLRPASVAPTRCANWNLCLSSKSCGLAGSMIGRFWGHNVAGLRGVRAGWLKMAE